MKNFIFKVGGFLRKEPFLYWLFKFIILNLKWIFPIVLIGLNVLSFIFGSIFMYILTPITFFMLVDIIGSFFRNDYNIIQIMFIYDYEDYFDDIEMDTLN